MAFLFTEPDILNTIRGNASYPVYNFVEIHISSDMFPNGLFLTDFESDITGSINSYTIWDVDTTKWYDPSDESIWDVNEENGVSVAEIEVPDKYNTPQTWYSDLLGGISTPARTGNITQEIQRLKIAQGLSGRWLNASEDILTGLGANFHNCEIVVSSYMYGSGNNLILNEPMFRSNGIIKSVSRDVKSTNTVIEFSNSFGKLDGLKELRTTPGSLYRRTPSVGGVRDVDDGAFDSASLNVDAHLLNWGVKP